MRDFNLLPVPKDLWMARLRKGHYIWLVKEQQIAQVSAPWEAPSPGHCSGNMFIERFDSDHIQYRRFIGIQYWFVDGCGRGLDKKQLIQPIEGNLPDDPEPIPSTEIQQIHRALANIMRRLELLELGSFADRFFG